MGNTQFSRRAIGLLALASGVSSCTLIDPHATTLSSKEENKIILAAQACPKSDDFDPDTGRLKLDKIPDLKNTKGMTGLSPYCQFYGQLPAVIAYAYAQSEEFDGAISSQSVLKNGIALGVIPAAAAGLFFGINGGHTDAILGLASGSAAALGLGSFLSSEPRQAVYSSGSLALACSILKVSPYLVDKDQYRALGTDFTEAQVRIKRDIPIATDLAQQLADLDQQIAALVAQIKARHGHSEPGDTSALRNEAAQSIKGAEDALADATELLPKVLAARMKIDQASVTLEQAVHNIAEQVSREVTKTEPDINTIRALAAQIAPGVQAQISGIRDVKKALAPQPAPAATTTTTTTVESLAPGQEEEAVSALAALQRQVDALVEKRTPIEKQLRSVVDELNKDTLSLIRSGVLVEPLIASITAREAQAATVPDCIVEAAQVGFTISPPGTELPMKVGETKGVIVNGAVGTANGSIVAGKTGGIEFNTTGNGTGLLVNMTAKTPGNYVVAISDSTGKGTKTINVPVATGLTLKSGGKDVTDTLEIAKNTDTDIAVAGGSGALDTSVPGTQTGLSATGTTGTAADGKVTIKATGDGPYKMTIMAGDEQRTLTITVKK